jgi:hypothetical protein
MTASIIALVQNDRLLLGLRGTMSEAELHILRARLDGGIRTRPRAANCVAVGFIWGDREGEVRFYPDQAVSGAISTVFERFAEFGSARHVWLWFHFGRFVLSPIRTAARPDFVWRYLYGTPPHPDRCMLALTPTARTDPKASSMNTALSRKG